VGGCPGVATWQGKRARARLHVCGSKHAKCVDHDVPELAALWQKCVNSRALLSFCTPQQYECLMQPHFNAAGRLPSNVLSRNSTSRYVPTMWDLTVQHLNNWCRYAVVEHARSELTCKALGGGLSLVNDGCQDFPKVEIGAGAGV
jgi:hypothetical protein